MLSITLSLFLSGLAFGSGPCIASCGPFLVSYVAGTKKNITKALLIYIIFSLSRISVYAILSLLIFFLGQLALEGFLGDLSKYVYILGGAFVILIGILMAVGKSIELKPCQFLKNNFLEQDTKSIIIMGLIIGILPCAPLLAIFSYIGLVSKSWFSSLLYSLFFGIGTALSPLLLLVIMTGLIKRILQDKKEIYYRIFSAICGLIIIFLGIQLIGRVF